MLEAATHDHLRNSPKNYPQVSIQKFRNKSNWSPKNQDAQVETYIRMVITEFQKLKLCNPPKTNLTMEEKQRLNLLQIRAQQ